jgi:hypothetical protein
VKPNGLQNGGKIQLVQNTNPITEKPSPNSRLASSAMATANPTARKASAAAAR